MIKGNKNKPEATYARLGAVLNEGFVLGQELNRPVSIAEASFCFAKRNEKKFLADKTSEDHHAQLRDIEVYKYGESQRIGYDIGWARAEMEWTEKYAESFRRHRESPRKNGFIFIEQTVVNNHGLHMRPSHEISEIVRTGFCNVFVNHEKVQDMLAKDFVNHSLEPAEQEFIGKLMPQSDITNLSALSAMVQARSRNPEINQNQKDGELRMLADISLKYRQFLGDTIPENVVEMADYDLKIEDEFNVKRPYMDLSYRKNDNDGSVTPDLLGLEAIPGDILRFVIFGRDKDMAAADILFVLDKRYYGVSKEQLAASHTSR